MRLFLSLERTLKCRYIIQGSEDKLSPTSMVRQYYDSISAPEKKMIVLDDAGHLAILRNRGLFRDALLDIKPLLLTLTTPQALRKKA